eukprot:jgi/Hompol1/704/HPOL_000443-RA
MAAAEAALGLEATAEIPTVDWESEGLQDMLPSKRLTSVQVDALAVLKIVKHSREAGSSTATGQLLGIDVAGTLEVTNCFPFLARGASEAEDYQLNMLLCLRALNYDAHTVGWYQSTHMGSFWNQTLIDTQYNYQKAFANAVVLIYDPARSANGNALCLRALRLTDTFLSIYESGSFSIESITKHKLSPSAIFESIPISVQNAHLLSAAVVDMNAKAVQPLTSQSLLAFPSSFFSSRLPKNGAAALLPNLDNLELSSETYLEKHLEYLAETIEEHGQEQWRWHGWQRSFQKEQQKAQQQVALMTAENAAALAAGAPPVHTEEDLKAVPPSLTKVINNEPSRLETFIIANQIDTYCQQINQFAGPALSKMFIAKSIQP